LRECEFCGRVRERHVLPNGEMEAPSKYRLRRFCSNRCATGYKVQQARRRASGLCELCGATLSAYNLTGRCFRHWVPADARPEWGYCGPGAGPIWESDLPPHEWALHD
jgi:hypothetical protein